jgi:hypothetical protein
MIFELCYFVAISAKNVNENSFILIYQGFLYIDFTVYLFFEQYLAHYYLF